MLAPRLIPRPDLDVTNFFGIITAAPQMRQLFPVVERVARTNSSVLVRGETGTGKELVARAVHELSPRNRKPLHAVNCATLSGELLASELFGHIKGAFTGATRDRQGLFQAADGGSVFLDEIAELPVEIQARLLRVLQEQTFTPLGTTDAITVDVRLISASNKALRWRVQQRLFREDLMYRIRVVPIFLPRLTEREGDVEALLWHFIDYFNAGALTDRRVEALESEAYEAIQEYAWPGNVRELRNVVEYAFAVGEGPIIRLEELTPELRGEGPEAKDETDPRAREIQRIKRALKEAHGRKSETAQQLGMSRSTLWRKLREYHLE